MNKLTRSSNTTIQEMANNARKELQSALDKMNDGQKKIIDENETMKNFCESLDVKIWKNK